MDVLKFWKQPTEVLHFILHVLIYALMVLLLVYAAMDIYNIVNNLNEFGTRRILHDIAFFVVIVKAYMVLYSYFQSRRVSLRYIVEISIVAPFVEVIFAFDKHDLATNIFLGTFGIICLIVLCVFYEKLSGMGNEIQRIE
jgi:uncharacterized membrane protein (DUF373 family)